jgi:CSLREA domain-containing protein
MNPHARIVTLTVTVLLAVGAGPAAAATLTVDTTSDNSPPGDGACSLREAIAAVDSPGTAGSDCQPAAFGANTIVLGSATYTLSGLFAPSGSMGELVVAPTVTSLTIVGTGETKTKITGSALPDRLLEVSSGATVTIKDLTLTGGTAPRGGVGTDGSGTDGGQGASGGAILNGGSLTLIDSAVSNSRAGDGGRGGVGVGFQASVANGGSGGAGGAGGVGGGIYNTGTLTLRGTTIAGNSAGAGGAGGQGGDGTIAGGIGGTGGAGGQGGGVANVGGALVVIDSTFRGNNSGDGGPGGNGGPGPTGGTGGSGGPAAGGGGIVSSGGSESVTNSTFASNSAGDGGAGGNGAGASGAGNAGAGGNGGGGGSGAGIDVLGVGNSSVQSVTIAGNNAGAGGGGGVGGNGSSPGANGAAGPAGAGGGIASQGVSTSVQNSLLASNDGGNCSASVIDSGHNLSFAGASCPATFASGDPNLGPLQNNGGSAQTISLGPGSAAIDKIPTNGAGCPTTDERGVHRPSGSACDIGAYEVAPPKATTGRTRSVTSSGATLTASVTPNAGGATVQFQFGTTKKYKSKTAVQHIGGVAAVTVTAKVRRLRQGTLYHYRVVVIAPDGTIRGQDRTFKTSIRPTLRKLSVKPAAFRASGPGATISYVDSESATTTFTVLRCAKPLARGARCARFVKAGSFSHRDRAGANKVALRGRIGGRTLSPGTYRLKATPRKARKTGNTATAKFLILG